MSEVININNEIVNFLSRGARFDVTHYRGTKADRLFEIIDSPPEPVSTVVVTVSAQKHGTVIKTWTINQSALPSFTWEIAVADLAGEKPLNYWVDAVDQDGELLFYGNFELL